MTNNTQYTAVVDRIVDGDTAVFIIEEDGAPIEQVDVPLAEAPPETAEGNVFTVVVTDDGETIDFEHQPAETEDRLQTNRERLDRLGEKLDRKRDTD